MSRVRRWCFTLNNYTEAELTIFEYAKDNMEEYFLRRLIVGKEVGEKGTPHLQGYLGFTKPMTVKAVNKLFGNRLHLSVTKGTEEQNDEYCSKECIWIDVGTNAKPGARTDIAAVKQCLQEGGNIRGMFEKEQITSFQGLRMAEHMMKYFEGERHWAVDVFVFVGEPGSGKSRMAYEENPEAYTKPGSTGKWWEGYDGHETVIMDDFRDSDMPLTEFLRIIDRHPHRVECKGGSRQLLAKKIIITTVIHPDKWYGHAKGEPKAQISRRIKEIWEF